jgi:polysaccharide export outer membrane protein
MIQMNPDAERRLRARAPRGGRSWVILAALPVLAGCAGTAERYPPPSPPMAAREPIGPYRIRVSDVLGIRFYKTPELNVDVPVRSDGMISIAPVGDVEAAGRTPEELANYLSKAYSSELQSPRVTVVVFNFGGQVFVSGEVKSPSGPPFASGLTALQAIALAGGFLDTAKTDNVILIRREGDSYRGYRLALNHVLQGVDAESDVRLQPGDILHVPKSQIGDLNMFVQMYIRNMLPVQFAIPAF